MKTLKAFWNLLLGWLKQGITTSFSMFRFMIPITILVKILQETGLIDYVGLALSPLMDLMGLPGEMGLVWASSIIANIYGGLIAFFSLSSDIHLTIAQTTVLTTIILIAHTFPIELMVTKKAGAKILPIFILRFGFGLLAGIILNWIYSLFGALQEYPAMVQVFEAKGEQNLWQWALGEAKNYGFILIWITGLIILLDILKRLHIIEIINKLLEPALKMLGIGKDVIPITVVGMTLGLAYGGGLIINHVKTGDLKKRDVFYAIVLMSLCHSMIEDSLLMMSIGGHFSGVFVFRILFALLITYLVVRVTKSWSETKMARWFYAKI